MTAENSVEVRLRQIHGRWRRKRSHMWRQHLVWHRFCVRPEYASILQSALES